MKWQNKMIRDEQWYNKIVSYPSAIIFSFKSKTKTFIFELSAHMSIQCNNQTSNKVNNAINNNQ